MICVDRTNENVNTVMSEYCIIFSIFGFVSLIQGEVILDDPPCLDEKNYGKDMFCLFGYASWCAPKYFLKDSLTVRYFGVAQLPVSTSLLRIFTIFIHVELKLRISCDIIESQVRFCYTSRRFESDANGGSG